MRLQVWLRHPHSSCFLERISESFFNSEYLNFKVGLKQYMEKAPRGTDSTKGLGKIKPLESEFETWEDNVTVPCGHPVPSAIKSDLMYNEYIVYNTSQVCQIFGKKTDIRERIYVLHFISHASHVSGYSFIV